jgi:hypothetical protein
MQSIRVQSALHTSRARTICEGGSTLFARSCVGCEGANIARTQVHTVAGLTATQQEREEIFPDVMRR